MRMKLLPLHATSLIPVPPPAPLQVGELGVVSFGGSGGVQPLHALERPFTDADGVGVMSQVGTAVAVPCCTCLLPQPSSHLLAAHLPTASPRTDVPPARPYAPPMRQTTLPPHAHCSPCLPADAV